MAQGEKHVLGLSGGKDSAALAVYMKQYHPDLDIDYFFTDTGKELPETYEFLGLLEGFLGKQIQYLNPDRDFDFWLNQFNNFLPSAQSRWCTKQLKLRPFEQWTKLFMQDGYRVYSYVAIRADEQYRDGYNSKNENLVVKLPLKDAGFAKDDVLDLLSASGLGLPKYYEWRSRSGCYFCFFQRKIEWVGLLERHPKRFEHAMSYEKNALKHGSPFTWSRGESLEQLSQPDRIENIKKDYRLRLKKLRTKQKANPLRPEGELLDVDDLYGQAKVCLACHK